MLIIKEIDFYPDIARKFKQNIISKYPNLDVAFSYNKELPQMVNEVENTLSFESCFKGAFVPKLKLDILFAIRNQLNNKSKLILFEVKYAKDLSLSNYSQLLGYLQIAKKIDTGVLFLVNKGGRSTNGFSNDFTEIVQANVLPMNWSVTECNDCTERHFQTAICQWYQGGRLMWTDASLLRGLSSIDELLYDLL